MKKKILHVINSMQPGGAEILLTNALAPGGLTLAAENHLAYFSAPSYLLDNIDADTQVHFLNYKGGTDIIRLIKQLHKIIVSHKIDIVHSHLNPAALYTHLACPKQVPHVHTIHTTYSMNDETSKFKLWTEKHFYLTRKNINLIFLSDFTKADFLNNVAFKGNAFVLNNFVPDRFFNVQAKRHQPFPPLKLIAIGSLKPLKNFEFLLDVFGYLKGHDISLDIYGGGDKTAYETKINENGLQVRMMGHAQNIDDIITSYDLLIMPSIFEGFPLSVFEAMAAGVPLMLSNIAPLTSIVKEHALYFNLDDAQKTAQQLLAVLHNQTDIQNMAEKAKLYAATTARREVYIKKLFKIYEDVGQLAKK